VGKEEKDILMNNQLHLLMAGDVLEIHVLTKLFLLGIAQIVEDLVPVAINNRTKTGFVFVFSWRRRCSRFEDLCRERTGRSLKDGGCA